MTCIRLHILTILLLAAQPAIAQPLTREAAHGKLHLYDGPSERGVDPTTMRGLVLCGYQGWFTTPDDGSGRGWRHYSRQGRFEPGHCSIDLWPDVSEFDEDEKQKTPFRRADGSPAFVFSSHNRKTVLRHFDWMKQYGIDGVFVQRFAVETFAPLDLNHVNTVLKHCREGANKNGRVYAVMYDLSGLQRGQMDRVKADWTELVDRMRLTKDANDKSYLHENGKPVVAVWGIGFNDNRNYTLDECADLLRFLRDDKQYGGCTVLAGVPTGWRTRDRDAVADPMLHEVLQLADILSPWTVGRYAAPDAAADHAKKTIAADIAWCRERKIGYLPVAFPGFSWHNMRPMSPFNQIPRRGGKFLWRQFVEAKRAGAESVYVAMFDEMDEATAIFKCTNSPPTGASRFVTTPERPTDHYLWLTGQGGAMLKGKLEATPEMPRRAP